MKTAWGGAQTLNSNSFDAKIKCGKPVIFRRGVYIIKYSIEWPYDTAPDLSRVELWINNKLIDYKNEGNLYHGRFIFNLETENLPEKTYLDYIITTWDKEFNCIQSTEAFYKF